MLARLALITFCFSSVASIAHAEVCVSPRIKRAKACGVVMDPYGMFIPNALVEFGTPDSGSSVVTNDHGRFSSTAQGEEVRLRVSAPGFQAVETNVGKLKTAPANCRKPLYVMLTIGEQGCAMISSRKSDLLLAKKE